jgi:hypothetical protein
MMPGNTIKTLTRISLLVLVASLLLVPACKESSESSTPNPNNADNQNTQSTQNNKPDQVVAEKPPANSEMVPLPLELPKPMFVGTPQNITGVQNLEKPLGRPRDPFLAPKGTINAASGKPVTSTDPAPIIGDLAMITDGDKEAADGSYVELGPFLQNVTIDLGAEHEIYVILLWHYHKQERVYFDVIAQISNDPDFIEKTTVFNNDMDNSAGEGTGTDMHYVETSEGKLIDAKGSRGRYVRLHSQGNNNNELNHYIEVEVWGKPVN